MAICVTCSFCIFFAIFALTYFYFLIKSCLSCQLCAFRLNPYSFSHSCTRVNQEILALLQFPSSSLSILLPISSLHSSKAHDISLSVHVSLYLFLCELPLPKFNLPTYHAYGINFALISSCLLWLFLAGFLFSLVSLVLPVYSFSFLRTEGCAAPQH